MTFEQFAAALHVHVTQLCEDAQRLYVVDVDTVSLWETYLNSFPKGTNEVYRERAEHDCSSCRHFVKSFGNVVAIIDGKIVTIWDVDLQGDTTYGPVVQALAALVRAHRIANVLVTKTAKFGVVSNFEQTPAGSAKEWHHLHATVPSKLVTSCGKDSEAAIMGQLRDTRNVFKRALDEITEDAVLTILELIAQKSLYKGEEWKAALEQFLGLKRAYMKLPTESQDLYAWTEASTVGGAVSKIRNHSIGTLLQAISNNEDLDVAVKKYEAIVAPANYKRPKAIFTKKMLEDAQAKLEELGLMDSLGRRHATLNDITVNNILFANRDVAKKLAGSVFDDMKAEITVNPKSFSKVEEISIERFVTEVLPLAKNVEVFLENRHVKNCVSLIAPVNAEAPSLFKWDNGFSWAYTGNITDSDIRSAVQARGGRVDGVFRFSHSWNYDKRNASLMDLHVFMPGHGMKHTIYGSACTDHPDGQHDHYGNSMRVGWNNRKHTPTGGVQDVDYMSPAPVGYIPVENTTFPELRLMREGTYVCKIHNWQLREPTKGGFRAEIEFDGQLFQYEVDRPLKHKEWITVAKVTLKNGQFTIEHCLPETASARPVWGLLSNQFHPVSVCMYSPNYWDDQTGIGHRHYFFMLKECVNPETPNGFFNEYLREEFMAQKRVFEALGSRMRVADSPDQLSGLGFSSTQSNSLILKVEGQTTRTLKVLF